jgi:hypothetical protein
MLKDFTSDRVDDKGRSIPGKETVFTKLVNPEVTDRVLKLGDATIKQNYRDWAENTFANDIFREPIQNMRKIPNIPGVVVSYGRDKPGDDPKFTIVKTTKPKYDQGTLGSSDNPTYDMREQQFRKAEETIATLNKGVKTMSGVAKAYGEDVDTYLLNLFVTANGVDPRDKRENSVASQMSRAVVWSRQTEQPGKGSTKASQYTETPPEPQGASLGEFLANPGRGVPAQPQNAPAASRRPVRGNLTNEDLLSTTVQDIPPGLSPSDVIRYQNQRR